MRDLEQTLREHPFLEGLDAEHIKLLVGCASNVVFKSGEFIIREGEEADAFYFIRHGRVLIETHVPQKGPIIIRSREAGEILGWSWLVPPYRWHFDARAAELTRAIALDGKCLREKCEQDHDLGYEVMRRFVVIIAQQLEATRLQLLDVYGNSANK
ncbi:MAG: cyclic nucleotide-binding domain-containing protein [candidate division Zixibacteria bacterium]|jgi:CRP-like cAMP-binding protein|nr:cyclic nucleotide-binding domain-containing protein [candidate division Zixibacteria bacterium]